MKGNLQLDTHENWRLTKKEARNFVEELQGETGYVKAWVNGVALKERLTGWIVAQRWFEEFNGRLKAAHPRDGGIIHASDMAERVARDVTRKNPGFEFFVV